MSIRRLTVATLVSTSALVGGSLFPATAVQAEVVHNYLSQITEVPAVGPHGEKVPAPGPLEEVEGMTVDAGELYVAGGFENSQLDKFNASTGAFVSQYPQVPSPVYDLRQGIAVGHGTGATEVYVTGDEVTPEGVLGRVAVYGSTGKLEALWNGADTPGTAFDCFECGPRGRVAVDSSGNLLTAGDVYVSDPGHDAVDVFEALAGGGEKYLTQLTGPKPSVPFAGVQAIAIDQRNGDLLVVDGTSESAVVDVFEPQALHEYALTRQLTGTPRGPFEMASGVSVDGGNGDIYVIDANGGNIDQFDSAGVYLSRLTGSGTPGGAFGAATDVSVDPTTHEVYVADAGQQASSVDVFGPDVVVPDLTTELASNVKAGSATLNGTVNPDEGGAATCRFEWGPSTSLDKTAPCEPEGIADGNSPVPVHAALSGLQPDTTYHYRLQAGNANGTNEGEASQDREFTTAGPAVHDESVSNVTAESATLAAKIDPNNAATTYYFQYGASAAYGVSSPVPPGPSLGAGKGDVSVSLHLQGLAAATTYHYRVVAISEPGGEPVTVDGPDLTFSTQTKGTESILPDGRAWEMVSPPEKYGANLEPITEQDGVIKAASAGNGLTYVSNTPVEAEPKGFAGKVQELSVRGPHGWAPVTITVPHVGVSSQPVGYGPEYRLFSNDLSRAAIQPIGVFNPSLSIEASEQTAFLRSTYINGNLADPCVSSCYRPLVTGAPSYANVPPGTVFGGRSGGDEALSTCLVGCGPNFIGGTPDMSHVVLQADSALTVSARSAGLEGLNVDGLYEWDSGQLTLIGGHAVVGNGTSRAIRHSISDDGSRIVIDGQAGGLEGLLMRDMGTGETVQLDAVQGGSGEGLAEPRFQAASSDGSRVLFTDTRQLTKDSGASQEERDLYECQMVREAGVLKCKLSDLTPLMSGEPARVQGGVLGVSEDGSWVYFVADGRLGTGSTPGTCASSFAQPETTCNLYVLHFDGSEWEAPKFIAKLLGADDENDWLEEVSRQPTRVSPDGRWLTFMSQSSLTGYDNHDLGTGHPDAEVYLYDAGANRLRCASCNPTGARPVGREYFELEPGSGGLVGGPRGVWGDAAWVAANLPGWQHAEGGNEKQGYQSRYLDDSGRLFFNSNDALVPQDVNGTEDVYEYEPPGVGSCSQASVTFSERSGGCVGLISSGTSPTESAFLDASEGGADVFFITGEQLVSQDFDTSLDIYDAHECSDQVPCVSAVTAPPPCSTGDACKPAPTPQPASYGSPASATFSGAGNVTSAGSGGVAPRSLSRAQKLARALKACRKKGREQRAACERSARRRYPAKRSRKVNRKMRKRG